MQASRQFAQYVRENGVNSGNEVCGIYRLRELLTDGRIITATFIDPYDQGVDNNPRAELRIFVPRELDAEQTGLGDIDSLHVFEQGQWLRLDISERAVDEYQRMLNSYLASMRSKSFKLGLWRMHAAEMAIAA